MRVEARTRNMPKLIGSLVGWREVDGDLEPPDEIREQIQSGGRQIVAAIVVTDDGVAFPCTDCSLVGVWANGVFCIYDGEDATRQEPQVCGSSVEAGLSYMMGVRWAMAVCGVNSLSALRRAGFKANTVSIDDLLSVVEDEQGEIDGMDS